ncbi:hypothetical protein MHB54_00615 [Paenibacillus sp. FSL M7-0802]|uniref:hypothetical protein n=1 Tax=Paenibacillus sp. FSL M7-0802 TaxID=2921536 RepID=UPI0030F74D1D
MSENEKILTESKTKRDELVFKDDVLDKIKFVTVLPGTSEITVDMAATYYEVSIETIKQIIKRHRAEFNEYSELRLLKGKALSDFKSQVHDVPELKQVPSITLISRRGLLRFGMLLTESEVAKSIRNYLLNVEEISSDEQKKWAVEREISKRERRYLTDAIKDFYEGTLKKGFEYSTFTNFVYRVLFETDANGLLKLYDLDKKDNLRDAMSTEDLRKIVEVEQVIKNLIKLGKDYKEIKEIILLNKTKFT